MSSIDSKPSAPDWPSVRRAYPGALRATYLDTACKGIPPPEAIAAVEAHCRALRTCAGRSATEDTIAFLAHLDAAREQAAALIGARPDEIALVESTQHGMSILADGLDLRSGDRVVTDDLEFLASLMPWHSLAERGVRTTVVHHSDGRLEVDDLAAAIDPRTRAVAVSSVQEVNGFRIDLDALGRACRERGVPLLVDGAQHVGAAPLDVSKTPIDALAVGAHKWLCSPFGVGFLYVRGELRDRLQPTLRGYMSLATPPGGWAAFLSDPGRPALPAGGYVAAASKLEIAGTPPHLGAAALAAAIGVLRALGPDHVYARVAALAEAMAAALDGSSVRVVTPREADRCAGIVCFTTGDPARDRDLHGALLDAGVVVSLRYVSGVGGIRASPHFYSDETDVERLAGTVAAL